MVTYPSDWKEVKVGDIFDVLAGGDVKKEYFSKTRTLRCPYEVFSNGIENRGIYGYTSKPVFPENSLTVTARGTIGQAYYRDKAYDAIIRLLVLIPKYGEIEPKFYEYFINRLVEFERENTGVPQLTVPKIMAKKVPSFDGSEQRRIVETLQHFDEHIDNLTQLIEKKKAIRDGALEDLVSGRTRIDGFDGEWVLIPFKQYFTLLSTSTYSREQLSDNGAIGNIHYGDVLIKYGSVLSENDYIPRLKDTLKFSSQQLLKKNDVVIADTAEDETVGKAVQIGNISIPLIGGLHTIACRPNYKTADGFLGYYINSDYYHDRILPYITGIKVSSISKKSIGETKLYIPSDIKEQEAIAQILITMDEEIESLKDEKEKMMQIREGVMDDLLTGRVRLAK